MAVEVQQVDYLSEKFHFTVSPMAVVSLEARLTDGTKEGMFFLTWVAVLNRLS